MRSLCKNLPWATLTSNDDKGWKVKRSEKQGKKVKNKDVIVLYHLLNNINKVIVHVLKISKLNLGLTIRYRNSIINKAFFKNLVSYGAFY